MDEKDIEATLHHGIALLGDCRDAASLQALDLALSVIEARAGRRQRAVRIIAGIASAAALGSVRTLEGKSLRLAGLAWDGSALREELADVGDASIVGHARREFLLAAKAIGLPAYRLGTEADPVSILND